MELDFTKLNQLCRGGQAEHGVSLLEAVKTIKECCNESDCATCALRDNFGGCCLQNILKENRTNDAELKPCPFCGGEAKFMVEPSNEGGAYKSHWWEFRIYCPECKLTSLKTYKVGPN